MMRRKEWNDTHSEGARKLPALLLGLGVVALLLVLLAVALNADAQATHARLPNPKLTPGKTNPAETAKTLCAKSFHTLDVRSVNDADKTEVYRRYGLKVNEGYCSRRPHLTKKGKTVLEGCEVDHLISLELGGANDLANLWPQPYAETPGAHEKDVVENWLHSEVCARRITLSEAQKQIASNWYAVYVRMKKAKP